MDWEALIRTVAGSMQLLDEEGRLKKLDSLTAIDLVVELETVSGVEVPTVALHAETFASIESLARALSEI